MPCPGAPAERPPVASVEAADAHAALPSWFPPARLFAPFPTSFTCPLPAVDYGGLARQAFTPAVAECGGGSSAGGY